MSFNMLYGVDEIAKATGIDRDICEYTVKMMVKNGLLDMSGGKHKKNKNYKLKQRRLKGF